MNSTLVAVAECILPNPILYRLRARQAINRGDNPELALLPRLNKGGVFIDVGANIGDWSRVAALHFRQVFAFEPNPGLVERLRSELPRNTTVIASALSDKEGYATLYIPTRDGERDTGLASLDRKANASPDTAMDQVEVVVETLDSFPIANIDLIKIDVEGYESYALRGARRTLEQEKPALIVEIEDRHHPGETPFVFFQVESLGYRGFYYLDGKLHDVKDTEHPNQATDGRYVNNFVFFHKERMLIRDGVVEANGRDIAPYQGV